MGAWEEPRVSLPSAGDWTHLMSTEVTLVNSLLRRQVSSKTLVRALEKNKDSVTVGLLRAVNLLTLRAGMKSPTEFLNTIDKLVRSTPGRVLTLEETVLALRNRASEPAQSTASAASRRAPQVVEDDEEHPGFKPNPGVLRSMADLRRGLRAYWEWAGCIGSRRVADNSNGAFKRSTALKLIAADPTVPLMLEYVTGMIAGCGGSANDQSRWASAYRRIKQATRERHLRAAG